MTDRQYMRHMLGRQSLVRIVLLLTALATLGMSGCESVPKPDKVRQSIGYGYATVTATREQANTLLEAKKITGPEARMIQNTADAARAALDVADTFARTGDQQRAQQALTVADESLKQLTLFIERRK